MPTTVIKDAECLIAWNGIEYVYLKGADIAFRDDRILFLGLGFDGPSDNVIDGAHKMIMPGLVSVHPHPSHDPGYRGIREEHGVPNMYMSGLYERATAMMRDGIGRIAEGCKADLVAIDLRQPKMMPTRDPLRSLIFHAADRTVSDVWINGRKVVDEGRVITLDHYAASRILTDEQIAMMETTEIHDYRNRTADELAPISLPVK